MTTLTSKQVKSYGPRFFSEHGHQYRITAKVRHDDSCKNGHNSFAIAANIDVKTTGGFWRDYAAGCCHDEVIKHFPELAPFIKWHLTSTDEPMHYIANTLYWLGFSDYCDGKPTSPPKLDYARNTAVWPDMPERFLASNGATKEEVTQALRARLQGLLAQFQADVETLGLVF